MTPRKGEVFRLGYFVHPKRFNSTTFAMIANGQILDLETGHSYDYEKYTSGVTVWLFFPSWSESTRKPQLDESVIFEKQ